MLSPMVRALFPATLAIWVLAHPAWGQTDGSQPAALASVPSVTRVQLGRTLSESSQWASIHVAFQSQIDLPSELEFQCVVDAVEPFDGTTLKLGIEDALGATLHEGQVLLDLVSGQNPCSFSWTPPAMDDGRYRAVFQLTRISGEEIAREELELWRITDSTLDKAIARAYESLETIRPYVDKLNERELHLRYLNAILSSAEDEVAKARIARSDGDWESAWIRAGRASRLADVIRVSLAFARESELRGGVGLAAPDGIANRDGVLELNGRPRYLFGATLGDVSRADGISLLNRYGLDLATIAIPPAETLVSQNGNPSLSARFDAFFDAANQAELAVAVQLDPAALPTWAYDSWPELANRGSGTFEYNIAHPAARDLLKRHVGAVSRYVSTKPNLCVLSLADDPEFQLGGEPFRAGFQSLAETAFQGRHDLMDRYWEVRYLGFDEVEVMWDHEARAYRYDLQTYQQELGSEFFSWLAVTSEEGASAVPVTITYGDDLMDSEEPAFGVNRESLARVTDYSGCSAVQDFNHPYLAAGFPSQVMYYTLLKSLAPERPVVNLRDGFILPTEPGDHDLYALAYSQMWEAVIAGLNASAMPMEEEDETSVGGLDRYPSYLAGYSVAHVDINRLSPIVASFQRAPANLAILWSPSSSIFDKGEPYNNSLKIAFEGVDTFGYTLRFITEIQCANGELDNVDVLILPHALAIHDDAFAAIDRYIRNGGVTIRRGQPIPYDHRGLARQDTLPTSERTVLIRGADTPLSYLHALDAASYLEDVPQVPRLINASGYPVEGVKSRFVKHEDRAYLYVINLRKDPVHVEMTERYESGTDLTTGNDVQFPDVLPPMEPRLILLNNPDESTLVAEAPAEPQGPPHGVVQPVVNEDDEKRAAKPAPRVRRGKG